MALSTAAFATTATSTKAVDATSSATAGATPVAPKPAAPAPKPATPKPATPAMAAPKPAAPTPVKQAPAAALSTYVDGVYVAFGNAYSKGTEGAKVTIKDGKVADVELMRTSPALIDRDARFNYFSLWNAYEPIKESMLGKTREEVKEVDAISGATRTVDGWKLAVDRAFTRALRVKPDDAVYFEGEHMGVDPEKKAMVFAKYDKSKLLGVKVYLMTKSGSAIEDFSTLTPEQAQAAYALASELSYNTFNMKPIKGLEKETKAVVNALIDAEKNAKIVNGNKFIDGFYSAYGIARDKGVERADVVIRNDKLVNVKLFRLGNNLLDRGNTAYPQVVEAYAPMAARFLANGSYFENLDHKVDAISGATESSHNWNLAIERTFEKAALAKSGRLHFDGISAGVDTQQKVLLLVDIKDDIVLSVSSYLFNAEKRLISPKDYTPEQRFIVEKLNTDLLIHATKIKDVEGYEPIIAAAREAFVEAIQNASKKQNNYKDGTFTAYGDANDKGNNRVIVTLRNGKIVDIDLARVGVNYEDRGETAYPDVVKAIPLVKPAFIAAATKEKAMEVDAISGATSSHDAWKLGIERAFQKAEIIESNKAAYFNGVHGGVSKDKSVYVNVTVENNIPTKVMVYFLNENGRIKAADTLTEDEKAVKSEFEVPAPTGKIHKYAYRPTPMTKNDEIKALSSKVIEAMAAALESAGK